MLRENKFMADMTLDFFAVPGAYWRAVRLYNCRYLQT